MKLYEYLENYQGEWAVWCKTREEALLLTDALDKLGRTWSTGSKYDVTYWDTFKQDTVYFINSGHYGSICTKEDFENYHVITFAELLGLYEIENYKQKINKKLVAEMMLNHLDTEFKEADCLYTIIDEILTDFSKLVDSWEVL